MIALRHLIPTLMCGVALGVFAFAAWISYRSEAYAITVAALGFFIAVGSVTRDEITHALRQYRSRKAMTQPPFTTEKG